MALNIKNPAVEKLAAEVAFLAGETKTQAIGRALQERKQRLAAAGSAEFETEALIRFLEREIWADLPPEQLGAPALSKDERERILGLGDRGV